MQFGDYITTDEAAVLLDVSERRLRAMVEDGVVPATLVSGGYVFHRRAIEDLQRVERHRGRPFGQRMAWMVLMEASGEKVVRGAGRGATRARELVVARGLLGMRHALRARGASQRYAVHPGVLGRVRDTPDLMLSGVSAAQHYKLGIASTDEVEAYVSEARLAGVKQRFAFSPDSDGQVLLRVVSHADWLFGRRYAPVAAVALDLADARDARSRELGEQLLRDLDAHGSPPSGNENGSAGA